MAEITPREAYNAIVDNNVELVSIENLPGTHRGKLSYPVSAGESRCCCLVKTSAIKQSASKLFTLAAILGPPFPGFEHETEGTEIIDGIYHVMCVKA